MCGLRRPNHSLGGISLWRRGIAFTADGVERRRMGPLSPVHALECERGEGPLSIPASCPYPAACAASGDVSPKAATGVGVLRRGLGRGGW